MNTVCCSAFCSIYVGIKKYRKVREELVNKTIIKKTASNISTNDFHGEDNRLKNNRRNVRYPPNNGSISIETRPAINPSAKTLLDQPSFRKQHRDSRSLFSITMMLSVPISAAVRENAERYVLARGQRDRIAVFRR